MRRTVLLVALACLLALGGQSFAELCTIDAVPAATLLLPYFEVGLTPTADDPVASATNVDTFFSVNNASAAPTVAHVVLWGDWSLPSIDFDIFLTGYDIETISLADVFNNGNLPITAHATNDLDDDISPHGQNAAGAPHGANFDWDSSPDNPLNPMFPGCNTNLPLGVNPVLDGAFADRVRCGHTGRGLACDQISCIGQTHNDQDFIARGYVTIDNVIDCNLLFPNQAGYFADPLAVPPDPGFVSNVNQLWGDWFIVQDGRAIGDNLVAIEASNMGAFADGDYTFYGRYVDGGANDQREPLASTWAARYFQPNPLFNGGTDLMVWRDAKCQVGVSGFDNGCSPTNGTPPWWPLDETQVVAFDLQEDATQICGETTVFGGGGISPPDPDITTNEFCFPLETGRYAVGEGDLNPPYEFGWLYLNLNFTLGDTSGSPTPCSTDGIFGDIAQSWVNVELDNEAGAAGSLSVGFAGTQLTSACGMANPLIGPIPARHRAASSTWSSNPILTGIGAKRVRFAVPAFAFLPLNLPAAFVLVARGHAVVPSDHPSDSGFRNRVFNVTRPQRDSDIGDRRPPATSRSATQLFVPMVKEIAMKLDIHRTCRAAASAGMLCLASWSPPVASAGEEPGTPTCLDGSPARPVEEFRTIPGQGTVEMWPDFLQPADPIGQDLPPERDSTLYNGFQRPGRAGGLEFFYDLDIQEDSSGTYLYMSYNAGFQIWDISGAFAASPQLLSQRDGWDGEFHDFEPPFTEFYFKIWDIDAIDPPASPGSTLVAVAGDAAVGTTIWDATSKTEPDQLYQDLGRFSIQVATANIDGRSYAFFASTNGVHVYDMTRAREIGPCFENANTAVNLCGGNSNPVWRGRLEPWPWGRTRYLDVLEADISGEVKHFVASSDQYLFNDLGAEIREITDVTSLPPTSVAVVEGLDTDSTGLDLFTIEEDATGLSRYYLGALNKVDLEIYDVTACLDAASVPSETCALSAVNRVYSKETSSSSSYSFVHFSESNGRPFLFQGYHSLCSYPSAVGSVDREYLLDLSGLATGGPIVEIRGEEYLDPSHTNPSRRIDYWSSYYDGSTDGFSAFTPFAGYFHGTYFYRGGQTVFDVHQWTGDVAPEADILAISSDRWLSSTAQSEWVNLSGDCNVDAGTGWSYGAVNAPGTPVADPDPVVEPQGANLARVSRGLCGDDTYPGAVCPSESVLIDADVICGGTQITSNELSLTLADPRPFFDSIDILETPDFAGPPPEYPVCTLLSFEALTGAVNDIGGEALTSFAWAVTPTAGGDTLDCTNVVSGTGLSCTESTLFWDTEGVDVGDPAAIFADGFESGDTSRWSKSKAAERGVSSGVTFDVTLTASNEHGSIDQTTQITLTPLDSLAFLGSGFTVPATPPVNGIYDFTATAENATAFYWEFEQDASLPGDPGCRLVSPCEIRTTTSPTVQYQWPIDNVDGADYDVWLEISNCDTSVVPISTVRTVENVVVVDLTPPDITAFRLVTVGTGCQCFAGICICPPGEARFTVDVTGDCDSLSFDWGDGATSPGLACDSAEYTHDYTSAGTYNLEAEACYVSGSNCDTQINLTNISPAFPVPLIVE